MRPITIDELHAFGAGSLPAHLGIEFTHIGPDSLSARMPVDARTVQPFRLLHGGASAALSETLGSIGAWLSLPDPDAQAAVGLELNANHLRAVPEGGYVTGTAKPIHIGRSTHVWQTDIVDGQGRLICTSRLTVAIIDRKKG